MHKKIYLHYKKHQRKVHIGFRILLALGIILSGVYFFTQTRSIQAANPVITSINDAPDPVGVGSSIIFTAGWTDPGHTEESLLICKTNQFNCSSLSCPGGAWAYSNFSSQNPISASSNTVLPGGFTVSDIGQHNYYAFIYNNNGSCSASASGTFTVTATPPNITSATSIPNPVFVPNLVLVSVSWTDPDPGTQVQLFLCKTATAPGSSGGCPGGAWCSTALGADNPIQCPFPTTATMKGDNIYDAYLRDNTGLISGGAERTFTVLAGDVYYDDEGLTYYNSVSSNPGMYQFLWPDTTGDSCDSNVNDFLGYVRDGMTVYSGGSLTPNCDAFGGVVRVDASQRFVADCDSSAQMCDSSTVNSYDPFSANGLCVQNTCDTTHVAKNCNYAEPNCSNYFNLCSDVSNNDRCYTGGMSYIDNGVCAAGSCVVKTAYEGSNCADGLDNDGDGTCDFGGCIGVPLTDTDCSGGPVPFIQTVAPVNQDTGDLNITINANGNPPVASYALYNTTLGKYVKQDGTMQVSEFWRLNALTWINLDLDTTGGMPGQPFTYQVKAKDPGPVTDLSNASDPNATHATYPAVPGAPSVSNLLSGTSQNIIINKNGNYDGVTGGVEYRIEVTSPSGAFAGTKYVPVGGGGLTDTANKWATYQGWGGGSGVNATGLTTGQTYSYKLKARNTNQEETTTLSSATVLQAVIGGGGAAGGFTRQLSIIKEVTNPANGILTAAGQTVTFRITVKNSGIEPTSVEYTITDILPPGFTFLGNITAKNPSGMIVSDTCNNVNLVCDGRTLKWTLSQVINNGAQISFQYNAKAP